MNEGPGHQWLLQTGALPKGVQDLQLKPGRLVNATKA